MKLTNLTSQQLRNVKTYADFGSKDLTIIVDSNNLINFNLLAIISGNISSKCHTTYHHYNLLTNKPHKFEALGQYAFNVIKSKYTWTKTAQETYAVYQELLK